MQAITVFFVAMVCGALAAEPAKVEFKYAYPAGAYPYAAAVAAPYSAYPYAAYPYPAGYPAGYTGFYPTVPVADAAKVAEKSSEAAADKADSKYYFAQPYAAYQPFAAYPYSYPVYQDKKE